MRTLRRNTGWWIVEIPDCTDLGPYTTKAEAEEDLRGLYRFYKAVEKEPRKICLPRKRK